MQLDILRHAKSSWAGPSQDDHERALTRRGERAAEAIGRYLAERGSLPEQVLCSSALRTRQTWERVSARLPDNHTELLIDPDLYLASPATLIGKLHALPGHLERILVLGHNPGVALLALTLANPDRSPDLEILRSKYPTAALTTLVFQGPWSEVSPGDGRLVRFLRPKDLA